MIKNSKNCTQVKTIVPIVMRVMVTDNKKLKQEVYGLKGLTNETADS